MARKAAKTSEQGRVAPITTGGGSAAAAGAATTPGPLSRRGGAGGRRSDGAAVRAEVVPLGRLESVCRDLLEAIGEDPSRPGLADTPRRFANHWREFLDRPDFNETVFSSENTGQLVIVRDIRVWCLCEHHLIPFWCDVTIGYIPRGEVLGLSKFARIAQDEAKRLQTQERLVTGIADRIVRATSSEDVAVRACGEHLCMSMRGARSQALMATQELRGAFSRSAMLVGQFQNIAKG